MRLGKKWNIIIDFQKTDNPTNLDNKICNMSSDQFPMYEKNVAKFTRWKRRSGPWLCGSVD